MRAWKIRSPGTHPRRILFLRQGWESTILNPPPDTCSLLYVIRTQFFPCEHRIPGDSTHNPIHRLPYRAGSR
jgi:hypothetical protein